MWLTACWGCDKGVITMAHCIGIKSISIKDAIPHYFSKSAFPCAATWLFCEFAIPTEICRSALPI